MGKRQAKIGISSVVSYPLPLFYGLFLPGYAAYGGVFIVMSILWGWGIDRKAPDKLDLIGGMIALIGVLIIMYFPRRYPSPP